MTANDYTPTHPNRKPQGNVYAYLVDRGRVWVESIHSGNGTAIVRFDANTGRRSRASVVPLTEIDFTREWKFRDKDPDGEQAAADKGYDHNEEYRK